MHQHEREVGVGVLGVRRQRLDQRSGGLLHPADDDEPVTAEQGGREDLRQLDDGQPEGIQFVHLEVGVAVEHGGPHRGHGPRTQQFLLPHDDPQPGGG